MTTTIENYAEILGIKPEMLVLHSGLPSEISTRITPSDNISYYRAEDVALKLLPCDMVILSRRQLKPLEFHLPAIKCQMRKKGIIWVLYPSGDTNLTIASICKIADRFGLALASELRLNENWCAIKLVDNS